MDKVHRKLKEFACDMCEYRAAQKSTLESHKSARHDWIRGVENGSLAKPVVMDEGRRNFRFLCAYANCTFTSSTEAELRKHDYEQHEKKQVFECQQCPRKVCICLTGILVYSAIVRYI